MKVQICYLVSLCVGLAAVARADDKATGHAMDPAMMQKWMEAATPGPQHKELANCVGTWDATVKSWMDPSQPPMESKGIAERTLVLGGRYLAEQFHGEMMGQPYEGMGYTGYDKVQKKWISSWMDNMSTGWMTSTGTMDASGKKSTWSGTMFEAMTGGPVVMDMVGIWTDDDHQTMEMSCPGPDGKKMKTMELHYTRRK